MAFTRWAILTGEYPPQPGGVADYTRLVARGLVDAGDAVTVFAPVAVDDAPDDAGIKVCRLPDHFGPRGLGVLDRKLSARPRPDRILIQYVPHAYGCKAMNLPFVCWVAGRARRIAPVWVMFHEVMFPTIVGQRFRHAVLGRVTRRMAQLMARSAKRVFVSIPAWGTLLQQIGGTHNSEWLPVPSNLPTTADPVEVHRARQRIAANSAVSVVGHFGTFSSDLASRLAHLLPPLLKDENRIGALVGQGGEPFVERFGRDHPSLKGRLIATGRLPAAEIVSYLAACDLLVQPYPDGASSRRGSLMAALALGLPVATTEGPLTESFWRESGALVLAKADNRAELIERVETLLTDRARQNELGQRAKELYQARFGVDKLVQTLRSNLGKEANHFGL